MTTQKVTVKACTRSGMCCKITPCGYGEWNDEKTQCRFLIHDGEGLHSCGKYEEISADPMSKFSPAFGQGCCSSMFNEAREANIKRHHDGIEQYVTIDW